MNLAAYGSMDDGIAQGNRRFLVGVGISIAVHVLLLFAYRHTGTSMPVFEPEPTPIEVSIRPLPPPPPPPRVEEPPPPRTAKAMAAPRSARKSAPKRVIAVPESEQAPSPDPFVMQQAEEPAPAPAADGVPKFSMDAAKQTARELAKHHKLGREGTALAQFPEPPLETESKYAKAISKAKRRNCKDDLPGGLLAPLFLMMDKKDSGCKW